MKKSMLPLTIAICLAGGFLTSCNTAAEKVENAQNEVDAASQDLKDAN